VKGICDLYSNNEWAKLLFHVIPWALELRASNVREGGFLPLVGREVPVAGTGFVVVSAGSVRDGRSSPIIHAYLQERSLRNLDPGFDGAAFETSTW
jgi:hypothetical protein